MQFPNMMINDIEKAGIMNHELGFKTYHRMLINSAVVQLNPRFLEIGDYNPQQYTSPKL